MSIHIKPENRGKFNATKARTGKSTEELTHSSNPVTKKRAVFAQNAAKWKHANGGPILEESPYITSKGINLNLPVNRQQEVKPLKFNGFLANDRKENLIVGGINPRYQTKDFSVGPYAVGVGNKHFQKFPADMGMSGTYHVNDRLDIDMQSNSKNVNAGLRYKFGKGGSLHSTYKKYLLGGPTDETDRSNFITSRVVPGTEDMSLVGKDANGIISGNQTPFSLWSTNQNIPAQTPQEGVFNMADNQQREYKVKTPEAPDEFKNKELAAKSYSSAIQAGTAFIGNFAETNRRKQEGAHDTGSMDDIKGAAKGMGTGAAIGSTFGPIGTAVGAAVGGVAGYIGGRASGKAKKKAYDEWQANYMKAEQSVINSNSARYQDLKPTSSGYYRNGGALSKGYLKTMAFGGDTEPDTAISATTANLPNSKFTYVPSSPAPSPQMPSPVSTYTRTFKPNPSGMPVYNPSSNSTEVLEQGSMRKGKLDPVSYLAKKKLLEENGSPDVTTKEGAWPHYNPFSSTIVLPTGKSPNKFTRNLIEETAHSKQDKENPIGKGVAAGWAKDWLRSPSFSMKDYQKFYSPRVIGPDYMEYEAHGNIAPGLHARYGELRDSLKGRQNKGLLTTYRNGGQTKTPVGYDWKSNAKYNKAVEDTTPKQREDFSPAVNYAGNVSVQTLLDQTSPGKLYNMYNTGKDAGKAFKNKDYLKAANLISSEFVKLGVPVIGDMVVNAAQEAYSPSGNSFNQLKKDASTVSSLYKKANGGTVKRPQAQAQFTDYTGTKMYGPGGSMSRGGLQVQPTRQDSLDLYNNSNELLQYYRGKDYKNMGTSIAPDSQWIDFQNRLARESANKMVDDKVYPTTNRTGTLLNASMDFLKSLKSEKDDHLAGGDSRFSKDEYYQRIDANKYKQRERANWILDLRAPMGLYDSRITPTFERHYNNVGKSNSFLAGDGVSFYSYDPQLVKPADMKTAQDYKDLALRYPNKFKTTPNTSTAPKPNAQPVELQQRPVNRHPDAYNYGQPYQRPKVEPKKTSPRMQSLQPQRMQSSPVSMQGQPMQIQPMTLPQQKGKPVYGPGGTIIGYNGEDGMMKKAYQYTGAPNNELNLQDKALLEDKDKWQQYLSSKDSGYKFATGGSMASNYMANQKAVGGSIQPMSKDASIAVGPSHEQGGIALPDQQAEIEGGETMSGDYVFSKQLGFAALHKPIARAQGKIEAKASTPERLNTLKLLADKTNKLKLAQEYMKKQLNLQ